MVRIMIIKVSSFVVFPCLINDSFKYHMMKEKTFKYRIVGMFIRGKVWWIWQINTLSQFCLTKTIQMSHASVVLLSHSNYIVHRFSKLFQHNNFQINFAKYYRHQTFQLYSNIISKSILQIKFWWSTKHVRD